VEFNELISGGNTSMEENRFEDARRYYREALQAGASDPGVFANLTVAEDWERLSFWGALSRRYPDSMPVLLAEARSWSLAARPERALAIYNDLLTRGPVNPLEEVETRLARFHVAMRAHDYDIGVSDFEVIWRAADTVPSAASLRKGLLRTLAQVDRADAIIMFETLHARIEEPLEARIFFAAKVAELRACAVAQEVCATTI